MELRDKIADIVLEAARDERTWNYGAVADDILALPSGLEATLGEEIRDITLKEVIEWALMVAKIAPFMSAPVAWATTLPSGHQIRVKKEATK